MNNKGMTITELLVSIIMLSVSMILMYGLISNLLKKKNEVELLADDLIKISDIEKKFQDLVMSPVNFGREKIKSVSLSRTANKITISITKTDDSDCECNVEADNYNVSIECGGTYCTSSTSSNKWTLKKQCEFDSDLSLTNNDTIISGEFYKFSYNKPTPEDSCTKKTDVKEKVYNIVFKCSEGNVVDYIKLPMYFSNVE